MTAHSEYADMVPALALDSVDDIERARIERHVAECEQCTNDLAQYRRIIADLHALEPVEPDPRIRTAVLERISEIPPARGAAVPGDTADRDDTGSSGDTAGRDDTADHDEAADRDDAGSHVEAADSERRWSMGRLAVAAAVVLASVLAGVAFLLTDDPDTFEQVASAAAEGDVEQVAQLADSDDSLNIRSVDLDGGATAWVVSDDTDAVVATSGLPALEGDQVYQTWVLSDDGPTPAGVLDADANPGGIVEGAGSGAGVAISVEPAGGSDTPSEIVVQVPPAG